MHSRSLLIGLFLLFVPAPLFAHGTMQKVVEGKYVMNLSSAPIAPEVGREQQNILAISDIPTNSLFTGSSLFDIQVQKNGKIFATFTNLVATGGLLQFNFTYPEPGMYELYTKFRVPGDEHMYEPEDYWIQVVPKVDVVEPSTMIWQWLAGGLFLVGFVGGFVIRGARSLT